MFAYKIIVFQICRETRYLAAYTNNANKNDLKYTVKIEQHTCQKSAQCLPIASCPDLMKPKTFLQKICGEGKVCCEKSPGILQR